MLKKISVCVLLTFGMTVAAQAAKLQHYPQNYPQKKYEQRYNNPKRGVITNPGKGSVTNPRANPSWDKKYGPKNSFDWKKGNRGIQHY